MDEDISIEMALYCMADVSIYSPNFSCLT